MNPRRVAKLRCPIRSAQETNLEDRNHGTCKPLGHPSRRQQYIGAMESDTSSQFFDSQFKLRRFAGWQILRFEHQDFSAPNERVKSFVILVARKPEVPAAA
jgi:hypothetical protein